MSRLSVTKKPGYCKLCCKKTHHKCKLCDSYVHYKCIHLTRLKFLFPCCLSQLKNDDFSTLEAKQYFREKDKQSPYEKMRKISEEMCMVGKEFVTNGR